MGVVLVNVAENGRMVLPAEVRRALGMNGPSQIRVEVVDDGVRITTPRQALMRARARIRSIVPADRSLSDELIADRRAEVEQEESASDGAEGSGTTDSGAGQGDDSDPDAKGRAK